MSPKKKEIRLELIKRRHEILKKIQEEKKLDFVVDKTQREPDE